MFLEKFVLGWVLWGYFFFKQYLSILDLYTYDIEIITFYTLWCLLWLALWWRWECGALWAVYHRSTAMLLCAQLTRRYHVRAIVCLYNWSVRLLIV